MAMDLASKHDKMMGFVSYHVNDEVLFVDPGVNLFSIICPLCKARLQVDNEGDEYEAQHGDWWAAVEDDLHFEKIDDAGYAYENSDIVVPCCSGKVKLGELEFNWPAGLSKFVLVIGAVNTSNLIDEEIIEQFEKILKSPLYQIRCYS